MQGGGQRARRVLRVIIARVGVVRRVFSGGSLAAASNVCAPPSRNSVASFTVSTLQRWRLPARARARRALAPLAAAPGPSWSIEAVGPLVRRCRRSAQRAARLGPDEAPPRERLALPLARASFKSPVDVPRRVEPADLAAPLFTILLAGARPDRHRVHSCLQCVLQTACLQSVSCSNARATCDPQLSQQCNSDATLAPRRINSVSAPLCLS